MKFSTSNTVFDPVCGMKLDPKTTDLMIIRQGCSYYFCGPGCRKAFEANPKAYLQTKTVKKKSLWNRYLERLNRATRGQTPQCH